MQFHWDTARNGWNRREPGFGFDLAALIFEGETIEWPDDRRDYGEARIRAIGEADCLVLHIVFTDRDEVRRIISARIADRKEPQRWNASR